MERDYICILNICLVCMLWYSKENPACVLWIDSTFWNTCSILMHIVIIKGIEKKKKKKFIQFIALRNMYNIMKCFKNQRAHFNELVTSVKARRNEASKTLINFWNYLTHKIIMYGSVKNSLKLSTCTLL